MGATGHVPLPQEVRRRFWQLIAAGSSTEDASAAVGVTGSTGRRWFVEAGGIPPVQLAEPNGRYLSVSEREEIAPDRAAGLGVREIARRLERSPSTISRELARGCLTRRPAGRYKASVAQARAEARARRPKPAKLTQHPVLRDWVADKLEHLQWSPEQISHRLRLAFPDDESMRISHEAIYQSLYVQGRGALRRELAVCLRTGRALRKPRRRADGRRERIKDKVMISERPAEVADRAVPGHWEGDLMVGKDSGSAVGTLVERTTRFTMLLHLPADHGAEAVAAAITAKITTMPVALRRTLTWDQGIELARHAEITIAADLPVYFCDPHSPWQRGSNENTNGLLRQYLPKGTDLSGHSAADLDAIADKLNGRPRKTLGFHTPAEELARLLSDDQLAGVASTS
ncbi:IS30 family transposase [Blastococcus saxobsidens]|uniref:Transposase n=1 Tax=Blastococcus saxobsidens (strain DD2) TaxID=1146883 RepID=H6RPT6_BLASD|nr:IS30 family transposase [Blastococcus saxobsidens]CCG01505.1 transposase [Blastococcus saxobsidens DD2]